MKIEKVKKKILLLCFCIITVVGTVISQSVEAVTKVSITVSNLERSLDFYTKVLPFEKVRTYTLSGKSVQRLYGIRDSELSVEVALLRLGEEYVELMEFNSTKLKGRNIPLDSRSNDLWFQHIAIVVSDMEKAYEQLAKHQVVHVSTAPQTLPDYIPAAAGIAAFYFQDPDKHNLEIIYFPKGKGNPKWQNKEEKIFLGIDHTAIGIDQTEESLAFYQDLLHLKVAGNSENYGSEQEHLNQVFGARLLITGLQAKSGFGVEFLDYISPPGGRAYPKDSEVTDYWHWHTSLKVSDVKSYYNDLLEANYEMISSGLVSLDKNMIGTENKLNTSSFKQQGFLVRGPDGHAIFIYQ